MLFTYICPFLYVDCHLNLKLICAIPFRLVAMVFQVFYLSLALTPFKGLQYVSILYSSS